MNTSEAAILWKAGVNDVRSWCRNGEIAGTSKEHGKWVIPDDARRPLDKRLQTELLWRILELQQGIRTRLDLTDWGIRDADLPEYVTSLFGLCLRSNRELEHQMIEGWNDIGITEMGMKLLGRKEMSLELKIPPIVKLTGKAAAYLASYFLELRFGTS